MSTNEYMYDTGWNSAVEYIARLLRLEAEACIKDIVPGDEIGRRDANARAGALLTAEIDVKALTKPSRVTQKPAVVTRQANDAAM